MNEKGKKELNKRLDEILLDIAEHLDVNDSSYIKAYTDGMYEVIKELKKLFIYE
jgi:hypothetical protein